jgi:hypothetical protein
VLNFLDEALRVIIKAHRKYILLDDSNDLSVQNLTDDFSTDLRYLKVILKFSAALLRISANKEIYNSTEVKYKLFL